MWCEAELHARQTVKIPTHRHSYLYAAVQDSKLDDLDGIDEHTTAYTTKRPFLPIENPDISLPSEGLNI